MKENIYVFDSDLDDSQSSYDAHHLQDLEDRESTNFWFKTRRDKICGLFEQKIDKKSRILEIGGGTGFIADSLIKRGFSVEMADIHFNGLKFAQQKGIERLYQFDLYKPPFQEEFDVVCLFDVLEHQKDDKRAMECLKKLLKPGGKILLTVPAHQWLWNRDDRINGHHCRYNKKTMASLCHSCGLEIKHLEYFFIFILPLLFARAFINRDRGETTGHEEKLTLDIPLGLNQTCYGLTKLEFLLARWLPNVAGGSLFLMAEKPVQD